MASSHASAFISVKQPAVVRAEQPANDPLKNDLPDRNPPLHSPIKEDDLAMYTLQGFIKHPQDIPLSYRITSLPASKSEQLIQKETLANGMVFTAQHSAMIRAAIEIDIVVCSEHLTLQGVVDDCIQVDEASEDQNASYEITVCFREGHDAHAMRMAEQVCHIEHYHQALLSKGRRLTADEAAKEWIGRFARLFP